MNAIITEMLSRSAPKRRVYYSGQDFDMMQHIADRLTDEDRKAGREAPRFGYSDANWQVAKAAVESWLHPW